MFRNTILHNTISEYVDFYEAFSPAFARYSSDEVETRASMLFGAHCYITDEVMDSELNERLNFALINEQILDYTFIYSGNGVSMGFAYLTVARMVFDFIKNLKYEDLFTNKSTHPNKNNFDEDCERLAKKGEGKIVQIKSEGMPFYNNSVYFSRLNNVYVHITSADTAVFSFKKCKAVKDDIERRKGNGSDNDDIDGL